MKGSFLVLFCLCLTQVQGLLVDTQQGQLQGVERLSFYGKKFRAFYGIPFAKPPAGNLRFMDPEDPEKWDGVRQADENPEICLQLNTFVSSEDPVEPNGSEDCLYLNVFAPYGAENLPVMVYIHGGGFLIGSATEYNPSPLMDEDVVVVIIQYRLSVFGFMSLENDVIPGNFGLKDQIKALEWVQKNIKNFGGNPDSVTIFGESAGGASVDYLTLTPKSKGLFHRVIAQSGTALNPWAYGTVHRRDVFRISKGVDCDVEQTEESLKSCLQKVDAKRILLTTFSNVPFPLVNYYMVPYIDGDFIPESPINLLKYGKFPSIPRMYGQTKDEGAFFYNFMQADEKFANSHLDSILKLENEYQIDNKMKMINNRYFGKDQLDLNMKPEVIKMIGDWYFDVGVEISKSFYRRDPGLYTYELHHAPVPHPVEDFNKGLEEYVIHTTDLCFLFGQGGFITGPLVREEDLGLRKTMVKLWVNFARTGNPTPDGSLGFIWDPVSKNDQFLKLQLKPAMTDAYRMDATKFWKSLDVAQYQTKKNDEL